MLSQITFQQFFSLFIFWWDHGVSYISNTEKLNQTKHILKSSIDSTNMLVANLKPLYWALWPYKKRALPLQTIIKNSEPDCQQPWSVVLALLFRPHQHGIISQQRGSGSQNERIIVIMVKVQCLSGMHVAIII